MNSRKIILRILGVAIPVLITLVFLSSYVFQQANQSRAELGIISQVPQFDLITQNNEPFSDKDMAGQLNLVYFFFSSCRGPCPIIVANMKELYNQFDENEKIQFIGITVDPTNDSAEALKEYAIENNIDVNNWKFLTGEMEKIQEISLNGFLLATDSFPTMHSTKIVLVDHLGQIRQYYDGLDMASLNVLKTNVRELIKEIKMEWVIQTKELIFHCLHG